MRTLALAAAIAAAPLAAQADITIDLRPGVCESAEWARQADCGFSSPFVNLTSAKAVKVSLFGYAPAAALKTLFLEYRTAADPDWHRIAPGQNLTVTSSPKCAAKPPRECTPTTTPTSPITDEAKRSNVQVRLAHEATGQDQPRPLIFDRPLVQFIE